jgi:glycosyltransferase involved in cell wall biosynthesis
VVVGDGPDAGRLRSLAGRNIEFVGWQSDEKLKEYYAGCTALIFPGEEDFGIVPVEALATGKPVVAYAKGGALETVVQSAALKTGVLFEHQTRESLVAAVQTIKQTRFEPEALRSFALTFDREVFKLKMKEYLDRRWEEFASHSPKQ